MKTKTNKFILVGLVVFTILIIIFKINTNIVLRPSFPSSAPTQIKKPSDGEISQAPIYTVSPTKAEVEIPTTAQINAESCRDGDVVRQNVKLCSPELECYSLTPMDERYCRLPDGRCKFFCTDK